MLDIFPEQISEVRGKGLMLGLKCVGHNVDLLDRCRKEKLLLVPGGSNTLRILPPLIITYKEIEEGIERLQKAGYPVEMVDVDEQPTIAESAEVRGVPTTAIYENGVLVERVVGYEDVTRLKKRIDIYHKPLRLPAEKKK